MIGALVHYPGWEAALAEPIASGLINRTWRLTVDGHRAVLQRINPLFSNSIHDNIAAVTEHLAAKGMVTPRLIRTRSGGLFAEHEGAVWRLQTFVDGVGHEAVGSLSQARAAAALVGRFHRALDDLQYSFVNPRVAHDTVKHLARLAEAAAAGTSHRLFGTVGPLAASIAAAAAALVPLPSLPPRICHGDTKFNNVLFSGEEAVCLIDLDTVGPMALAHELGDAWRSWCNRSGEDSPVAAFDLDVFAASVEGYRSARALEHPEALLAGVEWISLELAARFATDALEERYFGWDPQRFATRGEHNLTRALGQWSLHQQLVAARPARARLLGV